MGSLRVFFAVTLLACFFLTHWANANAGQQQDESTVVLLTAPAVALK